MVGEVGYQGFVVRSPNFMSNSMGEKVISQLTFTLLHFSGLRWIYLCFNQRLGSFVVLLAVPGVADRCFHLKRGAQKCNFSVFWLKKYAFYRENVPKSAENTSFHLKTS